MSPDFDYRAIGRFFDSSKMVTLDKDSSQKNCLHVYVDGYLIQRRLQLFALVPISLSDATQLASPPYNFPAGCSDQYAPFHNRNFSTDPEHALQYWMPGILPSIDPFYLKNIVMTLFPINISLAQ